MKIKNIAYFYLAALFMYCLIFPSSAFSQDQGRPENRTNVTYIANTGFMIEVDAKKILTDALFTSGARYYMTPSEEIRSKIINGESPFDSVNLLLITHSDIDHINPATVCDFLEKSSSRYVVCSNLTATSIKNKLGSMRFEKLQSRILSVTPDLYSSIHKNINGVDITILRLRHSGSNGEEENLGFIVTIDDVKIFHGGDNDGYVADNQEINGIIEYSKIGIEKSKIDIAIINRGMFWEKNAPGIEIIKNIIKPKHIILTHFSKGDSQKEYESVINVINENRNELPDITIFDKSMDSKKY